MRTATLYEQPALFPGVSPYLVPAYEAPRARESSPPEQTAPFNHGDLVAPSWSAGRDRRGRVVEVNRKGKHWWAVIAWFEQQRNGLTQIQQGQVRTDQLTLVEASPLRVGQRVICDLNNPEWRPEWRLDCLIKAGEFLGYEWDEWMGKINAHARVRLDSGEIRCDLESLHPAPLDPEEPPPPAPPSSTATPLPPAEPTEEPTAPPSSMATPLPPAEPTATATPPPPPDETAPSSSPFKVGDRVRVSQGCRKGLESTVTAIRPDLYNSIALEPGKGRFPSAMLELVAAPPPAPASKPERRHSPKGNACGWIEERQGNLKRKVPSTSYYYCWDSPQGRKRVYIKSRLVNTVHQMLENRQSIGEILEILGKTEGKPHQS